MANETRRIIIKKGAGTPTVPASNDHTDGTWLASDIYEGELYLDTTNGLNYTRYDDTIVELFPTSTGLAGNEFVFVFSKLDLPTP